MALNSIASAGRGVMKDKPGMMTERFLAPAKVHHGTILPSLLDEPLLELELALAGFEPAKTAFTASVTDAARALGGEFLYELPASSLMDNCIRLAVLRIPSESGRVTVFACLEKDGQTIRIEAPDENTHHLQSFTDAFVRLLESF